MDAEELTRIIENHKHYLAQDCEGWENMRADLGEADLFGADLSEADLSEADLSYADLSYADLSEANLSGTDLSEADLFGTDLSEANLSRADLSGVNLSRACLSGADLSGADLSGANLSRANLSGANLAIVRYNENTTFFALACPEEGDFIGWKKVKDGECRYIIKLRIPEDAKRSSATSRKCRCSHAEVLEIQNLDGSKADTDSVTNSVYDMTTYTVGKTVHADKWDEDRWNECSHGIHFFITRDEAVRY